MKLNTSQLAAVKRQTDADPVEEGSTPHTALKDAFGDHTFYVSEAGLLVPEPVAEEPPAEVQGGDPVELILVAEWTDEKREAMPRVEPQRTGFVLDADPANDTGAA